MNKKAKKLPFNLMSLKNNQGQGLTEYFVLLILIAVLAIPAVGSMGRTLKSKIQEARADIDGMKNAR